MSHCLAFLAICAKGCGNWCGAAFGTDSEERMRHQYSQLSQKYVDQLVYDELVDIEGILDLIGGLENILATLLTPMLDRALELAKKATRVFSKPRRKEKHFLFAFNALAASLDKIDSDQLPAGTQEHSTCTVPRPGAFLGAVPQLCGSPLAKHRP